MPSRRLTLPAVAVLALTCLLLGALAAFADGSGSTAGRTAPQLRADAKAATALIVAARRAGAPRGPVLFAAPGAAPCPAPSSQKAPAAEPVPQSLLDAFGVLRRDETADDALPDAALRALRGRGLEPFDPAAARLLRTTADGGRAWVVPVRDVQDRGVLGLRCFLRATRPVPPAPKVRRRTAPRAVPPTPTVETPPAAPAPAPVRPAPAPTTPAPARPAAPEPHPGLAVVAIGGAPAGAGGRLEDLVRGREPVVTDPCGGPDHDMLSVSGIVPDGVPAAFLTSPDGTAVRADVKDNAYSFLIPRPKAAQEQRYVVWTGGDGTPHVQPLGAPVFSGRLRCATPGGIAADRLPPTVSPDGAGLCGTYPRAIALPTTPTSRPGPLLLDRAPCVITAPIAPPAVKVLPRAPKRHK